MDNIRGALKKSPAPIVVQTLKTALTLPPAAARSFINELTKPTSSEKTYIKRISNSFWTGALIGKNIKYDSDAEAIRRLRRADVVIFNIHGMFPPITTNINVKFLFFLIWGECNMHACMCVVQKDGIVVTIKINLLYAYIYVFLYM